VRGVWSSSLYRRTVVAMWRASPAMTVLLALGVIASVVSSVVLVVAVGTVVGDLPDAVQFGTGSEAARRVEIAVLAAGVGLWGRSMGGAGVQAVAPSLGRQLEGVVRERAMSAALAPRGVAHLQDPAVMAEIDEVRTLGSEGWGPTMAVVAFGPVVTSLATGLVMAGIVASYQWYLGVALAAAWLFARDVRKRIALDDWAPWAGDGPRRLTYFKRLALSSAPAKEIRVFGLAGWLFDRFEASWAAAEEVTRTRVRRHVAPLVAVLLCLVVANVGAFVAIADGARRGVVGVASLTILVQAAVGTSNIGNPGSVWDGVFVMGASSFAGVDRLERRLGTLPPSRAAPPTGLPRQQLRLERVSFQYPGQSRQVLRDLDLTIPAGRSLALVGENGAGKTTLIKLLCGLIDPTDGSIKVDGTALDKLDDEAWRASLAVVFQDFARFAMSARENVAFGAVDRPPTDRELDDAAARAGLLDVVEGLDEGWDTPLSRDRTGGTDLSGGQWQRVALTRALLAVQSGASMLILDEPTASLDIRAEAAFYDRFIDITAGLTTIIVSHRFATVRRADMIAVIADGQIAELGSHEELMAFDGTYSRLFRLQADAFVADGAPSEGLDGDL
jgi:ATP-binding cassette subfamily B protein